MIEEIKNMIGLIEGFLSDKEAETFPVIRSALVLCRVAKNKAEILYKNYGDIID